ncbi:MAG: cyclic nucleotide-binding domain-containing protein [Gammaproteobacteria bacterium]|jgi:CRP-like cAMP-binding protein|nr:cyclic nucleotide-binding domain-containing protein [Gammaproteobacteria bacterium]MBT3488801.1 cyclic nucleotide-binding domain-containing protein [Gammaproteobacteria bacterium]MBT3717994.1 cyclic nucleotide-binding domain-containing protein [Gammaproteobacteria bacterium]MBT3844674.1 cyclic nucleotide-binding domain-containing protein [Gammaproteobacteria bacterium]MBT3892911.1 cyclic nucleotide-binding domain-containing protein [Gammaproteobacteria bacterium]
MATAMKKFSANEEVFKQGMRGEWAGVIRVGSVEVYIEKKDGDRLVLATLGKGEVFGELAILSSDDKRSATIRALEYTEIMQVSRKDINLMLAKSSPILRAIVLSLIKRMQRMLQSKA